jgi:hypothetical protein
MLTLICILILGPCAVAFALGLIFGISHALGAGGRDDSAGW